MSSASRMIQAEKEKFKRLSNIVLPPKAKINPTNTP
jgi:hypothetical protein